MPASASYPLSLGTGKLQDLRSALVKAIVDLDLGIPVAWENMPFTKPNADSPWASVFVIPNHPSVATLGSDGTDHHDGLLQVDLNYPLMKGEADVLAQADRVQQAFTAGRRLAYNATEAVVQSCGRSQGRAADGWYRISMTIAWFARIPRA